MRLEAIVDEAALATRTTHGLPVRDPNLRDAGLP